MKIKYSYCDPQEDEVKEYESLDRFLVDNPMFQSLLSDKEGRNMKIIVVDRDYPCSIAVELKSEI